MLKKREYNRQHPHFYQAGYHRRRARKLALPDTFTPQQWLLCLDYWHHCCAVCGKQLRDLFGEIEPHADHWHPLNQPGCPGTVPENMICLCSKCNLSKGDKIPLEWLSDMYTKKKVRAILERVNAYFTWTLSWHAQSTPHRWM